MIISGLATTPNQAIDGHLLLRGAIDVASHVPLYCEHTREIGQVVHLQYIGDNLHATVETDDAAALRLEHFSVAGRPIEREQRADGLWNVTKFRCTEISLVRSPVNPHCTVIERRSHDPMHELYKQRCREIELFQQAFTALQRGLQQLATL